MQCAPVSPPRSREAQRGVSISSVVVMLLHHSKADGAAQLEAVLESQVDALVDMNVLRLRIVLACEPRGAALAVQALAERVAHAQHRDGEAQDAFHLPQRGLVRRADRAHEEMEHVTTPIRHAGHSDLGLQVRDPQCVLGGAARGLRVPCAVDQMWLRCDLCHVRHVVVAGRDEVAQLRRRERAHSRARRMHQPEEQGPQRPQHFRIAPAVL